MIQALSYCAVLRVLTKIEKHFAPVVFQSWNYLMYAKFLQQWTLCSAFSKVFLMFSWFIGTHCSVGVYSSFFFIFCGYVCYIKLITLSFRVQDKLFYHIISLQIVLWIQWTERQHHPQKRLPVLFLQFWVCVSRDFVITEIALSNASRSGANAPQMYLSCQCAVSTGGV